jgi:hypothetical protein
MESNLKEGTIGPTKPKFFIFFFLFLFAIIQFGNQVKHSFFENVLLGGGEFASLATSKLRL